ncbi:MAG: lipoprotein signal peptidase [Tannerella sp.]|jgi:signal peptidase II|nr:lipoprotein signal peptidase [Tannerella sp.]
MQSRIKKAWGVAVIAVLLLTADQALKIWIKTHMQLHDSIHVFPWFQIYFTENAGMAFGMEFLDKRILSIFRILAVTVIAVYIVRLIRHDVKFGYIACIGLIFAGAFGNIIDSVLYGVIFDHSYGQIASFVPQGEGYAPLLYGKVVDMLYFPLIHADLPEWVPVWGGKDFIFFRPIFNLADSAICVGFALLLLFYRKTAIRKLHMNTES